MRDRARAEGDVDERIQLEQTLTLSLRVTAADGDHTVRICAFSARAWARWAAKR